MNAKRWNERHEPGAQVDYREDDGSTTRTRTRSSAWELGHGEPVVTIEGRAGGILLSRITAVEAPTYA